MLSLLMILLGCAHQAPPASEHLPAVLLSTETMQLDQRRWAWEEERGWAWCVRLPREAPLRVVPSDSVARLDALVPVEQRSVAVLNGGFYRGGAMGLVLSGGAEQAPLTPHGGSGVLFQGQERPEVVHRSEWRGQGTEALQSIDRLVAAGQSVVEQRPDARRAARSAVVLGQAHTWLVVHASDQSIGRMSAHGAKVSDPYGHGMPLWAFADWLITELGAVDALNMDGGYSTNLSVRTQTEGFEILGVSGTINAVAFRFE